MDGSDCAGTLTKQNANGAQRMPDKDNFGAVLQPTAYRWQNDALGLQQDDAVAALRASAGSSGFHEMNHPVVAHSLRADGFDASEDGTGRGTPLVPQAMTVRRLSAEECEALQGFSRGWTRIPWRGKPAEQCPDGPRYRALGNSMACNCMAWIGEKIAKWEADHE